MQSGSTAYPSFLYVGSSATITGALSVVGKITNASLDSSSVTLQGNTYTLNPTSVTFQGNTFNGNSQLLKTDSTGALSISSGTFVNATANTFRSSSIIYNNFSTLQILQIVQATQNTSANYNSATFVDTGITVSITPKLSTSKVFVMTSFASFQGAGDNGYFTISRAGTNLGGSDGLQNLPPSNNATVTLQYYDSPATTSSTAYTVQYRNTAAAGSCNIPSHTNSTAVIMAVEIAQ